jgi:acyl carrier protein
LAEAAVVAIRDAVGQNKLVAFVVPSDRELDEHHLRRFLKERLPSFMMPSVSLVRALPRTRTGKIDRPALSQMGPVRHERASSTPEAAGSRGPQGSRRRVVERELACLWAGVLGIDDIGPRDDFFDLGGHSLLALQLLARVEEMFGQRLALRALYEASTVETMAELLTPD